MRRDDYFLLIASGILKLPVADAEQALKYFGQFYELNELGKTGHVSFGGTDRLGNDVGFSDWVLDLQKQKIENIQCSWASKNQPTSLAPHLAAAFAGTQQLVLAVKTAAGSKTYLLSGRFSAQHEMTPETFIAVVDAQEIHDHLWTYVASHVLSHNQLNHKPSFDPGDIKNYLLRDGSGDFDFLSSQLIQELQIECTVQGVAFTIPESLQRLFFKSDFLSDQPVRKSVFLYPVKEISSAELETLIAAQPFRDEVWDKFVTDTSQYTIPDIPAYSSAEWPVRLSSLTPLQLSAVGNFVCRVICILCEEKSLERTIPESLREIFGPDEYEHKKAQARSESSNQWFLTRNESPWEAYVFEEVPQLTLDVITPLKKARTDFIYALESITAFAKKIESPFEEAFRLGIFFVTDKDRVGDFEDDHLQLLRKKIEEYPFTPQAIDQFDRVTGYSDDMKTLKFTGEKISDLLAVSIADVFGGMGSWNDQYIETDHQMFEQVSANLFRALRIFFSSVLSSPA